MGVKQRKGKKGRKAGKERGKEGNWNCKSIKEMEEGRKDGRKERENKI